MDTDLPRWQKALWTLGYAFSAGFAITAIVIDRITGRKP